MKKVLFIILIGFFVGQGQALAQAPWVWWPGNEAARVVAGNQAMIWSLLNQWPYPQQPAIVFQQPQQLGQVICRPRPTRHRGLDVLAAAGTVAGISGLATGSWEKAGFGAMAGAGGGALYANHEMECFVVQQAPGQPPAVTQAPAPVPTPAPAVPVQPAQPQAPVPIPPIVVEPTQPRLAGVQFKIRNNSLFTITVEANGRRAVLGSGATARVFTPDIHVFRVQPDGKGSFREVEIDLLGYEDETLPGWRIPDNPRFKSP